MSRFTFAVALLSCSVLPRAFAAVPPAAKGDKNLQAEITYVVESVEGSMYGVLKAVEDGKAKVVIDASAHKCLWIVEQKDFDRDGRMDALVADVLGCGGNCCPDEYFFVTPSGKGRFATTGYLADSWETPTVEESNGRWSVVVVSSNEGMNKDKPVEVTRRFALKAGKAVKLEEKRRRDLDSLVEMRADIFKDGDDTHSIEYDLDGDGKKDRISGSLWERWGRIRWSVRFANGTEVSSDADCKRIGVLGRKTKGVNDLVCDQDTVLHWDGAEYKVAR